MRKPADTPHTDCEGRPPVRHRRFEHWLGASVVNRWQHIRHVHKIGVELEFIFVGADILGEREGVKAVRPGYRRESVRVRAAGWG